MRYARAHCTKNLLSRTFFTLSYIIRLVSWQMVTSQQSQVVSDRWLQQGDYGYFSGVVPPSSPAPPFSGGKVSAVATPHGTPATGGNLAGPGAGRSLGLAHRPPAPLLPLHQQGYQAIRVSEDEVHQSIGGGTTTQRSGLAVGPGAGAREAAVGSPSQQK